MEVSGHLHAPAALPPGKEAWIGGWVDYFKIYLQETGCEDVDWIHLVQGGVQSQAFMNTAMNFRVP